MTIAQALLAEWRHEAASTRKMLQAVPQDKLDWSPHAKSMSLGHLAMHLGYAVHLFAPAILEHTNYVWSGQKQPEPATTEEIVAEFDKANAVVEKLLAAVTPETLAVEWSFGPKEKPFMAMPRGAALRGFVFSHMIHHRGQLSVYLRLLDVKVPGMYGPSADEKI
jgi:uncharacterized damage-inducible protein DinB